MFAKCLFPLYRKLVQLTVIFLILCSFFSYAQAQRQNKPKAKKVLEASEIVVQTDEYDKNKVCKGRALVKMSGTLDKLMTGRIENFFKIKDFPIFIRKVTEDNWYLFHSTAKGSTEKLFEVINLFLQTNQIEKATKGLVQIEGLPEPDYFAYDPSIVAPKSPVGPAAVVDRLWGLKTIRAIDFWNTYHTDGSKDIVVANFDTGMTDHPSLTDNIWRTTQIYEVTPEPLHKTKTCRPVNSYGFNFLAENATDEQFCQPADTGAHGTPVAGIIGARHDQVRIGGVAQKVNIIQIKVFDRNGGGCICDIVQGFDLLLNKIDPIVKAQRKKLRVINASFVVSPTSVCPNPSCTNPFSAFTNAVRNAESKGILIVAAAGNSGKDIAVDPYFPASFNLPAYGINNVVAVTASTPARLPEDEGFLGGSNYSTSIVALAAPGIDVGTLSAGGSTQPFVATSAAAPFVSGAAVLLMAACPNLTYDEVKQSLIAGANRKSGQIKSKVSGGRLDVFEALIKAKEDFRLHCP